MQAFELASRLAADCEFISDWPLCRLLLMRDAHYPWFILVPRRAGLRELCQLQPADRQQFQRESDQLARFLLHSLKADKLNIAALGNVEPQLHVHHIARFVGDAAWPAPVWGAHPPRPYTPDELHALRALIEQHLQPPD